MKQIDTNKWEYEGFEIKCDEVKEDDAGLYTLKFTTDSTLEELEPVLVLGWSKKREATKNKTYNRAHYNYEQVVDGYFGHMVPPISEHIVPLSTSDISS